MSKLETNPFFSTIAAAFAMAVPAYLLAGWGIPAQRTCWMLLLASLFFYAWGEPKFVVFMLASIVQGYVPNGTSYRLVFVFALVILVLIFRPAGLFGVQKMEKV